MSTILYIAVISLVISVVHSSKILAVFPVPSISHQVVFRPITQELSRRGHEVTVITPNPAFKKGQTPPRLKEIDIHDISYKIWTEHFMKASKGNKVDLVTQVELLYRLLTQVLDAIMSTEEVQAIMKDKTKKYDVLLLESCVLPVLGFSHVFKAPVILISSFGGAPGNFEMMGASEHPIQYPNILHQKLYNLTMLDKIYEIYYDYKYKNLHKSVEAYDNTVLKRHFGADVPGIKELANNIDLLLLNANPVFDGSRPVPQNIVYIGGIHQNPEKPLPADLKKYLDDAKNGVIYVSFGTNVDPTVLPEERIRILVQTFSKLPYDVLFKWNNEELPGRTSNIKISKWLPQSDLLKHPKVKLFITQGGLQSTDEAITAGVPLIGIPMLADQWYNVQKYVYHRIGEELDFETLTEKLLTDTINKIVNDKSYRDNIIRLRTLMLDQPMKPLERAIWWIEHVIRHGGAKHLRAPTANISWEQYLELELVFTILAVLLFTLLVLIAVLYFVYKYVATKFVSKKVKEN